MAGEQTLIKITAAILAAVGLASCEPAGRELEADGSGRLRVWTDADTGCDYITMAGYPETMMPRIASDGFHTVCADQKAQFAISSATIARTDQPHD